MKKKWRARLKQMIPEAERVQKGSKKARFWAYNHLRFRKQSSEGQKND